MRELTRVIAGFKAAGYDVREEQRATCGFGEKESLYIATKDNIEVFFFLDGWLNVNVGGKLVATLTGVVPDMKGNVEIERLTMFIFLTIYGRYRKAEMSKGTTIERGQNGSD